MLLPSSSSGNCSPISQFGNRKISVFKRKIKMVTILFNSKQYRTQLGKLQNMVARYVGVNELIVGSEIDR